MTEPGALEPGTALAQRLRVETDDAHRAAERAFDLDRRLTSVTGYGDVLEAFDAFALSSAALLRALEPALAPALRDGPARRRLRLRDDLVALGRAPAAPDLTHAPVEVDLDHALGAWYVHEGAALGGLVIAAEVRRRLPEAAAATRFFAGEGRATAARWRTVRAALDGWEAIDAPAVVAGARATFTALTERLAEVVA